MTSLLTRVSACLLSLSARLLTWFACVFALAQTMTWLTTEVRTTLELLATDFTATNIREPARLILESLLPTHARLLNQEGAFRAYFIVTMAIMGNSRMAATGWPLAIKSTRRRSGATW